MHICSARDHHTAVTQHYSLGGGRTATSPKNGKIRRVSHNMFSRASPYHMMCTTKKQGESVGTACAKRKATAVSVRERERAKKETTAHDPVRACYCAAIGTYRRQPSRKPEQFHGPTHNREVKSAKKTTKVLGYRFRLDSSFFTSGLVMETPSKSHRGEPPPSSGQGRVAAPLLPTPVVVVPLPPWPRRRRCYALPLLATQGCQQHTPH